jgi:hypothetical protein
MASWIQMPDGYTFALENIKSAQVLADGVLLTDFSNQTYLWPAGGSFLAGSYVAAIQAVMAVPAAFTVLQPLIPYISSVVLDNPDITLCANVVIRGAGFAAGTVGKLHFEDAPGGRDSNGYYMTCTYISPTMLTATYGGPGDADLGPGPVSIYYQDSTNAQSNIIAATNTTGTVVTIP